MFNSDLDNEKLKYDKIEIPEELDFIVKKSLSNARKKKINKKIREVSLLAAAIIIAFVVTVNVFPTVAYALSNIPGIDKLVELVTFDKGFDNAINEGLTKEMDYVEVQEGIRLAVNGIAGDWKRLWIGYDLTGQGKYSVSAEIEGVNELGEEVSYGYANTGWQEEEKDGEYLEISFLEYVDSFTIKLNVYQYIDNYSELDENKPITTFTIPIELEPEIFNSDLKEINLDNNLIETEIGDLEIISLESSKTRIVMKFKLANDNYEIMDFENPIIVDSKGNKYGKSGFSISTDEEGIKSLEIAGSIGEDVRKFEFKFDGIYYAEKNNRKIVVDLKNESVEPNDYNIVFDKLEGNELWLKADKVENLTFVDNDDIFERSGGASIGIDGDKEYYCMPYVELNDPSAEKIELEIFWALKDKCPAGRIILIE